MVRGMLADARKLKWARKADFAATPQPWDMEDQAFAHEIESKYGVATQMSPAIVSDGNSRLYDQLQRWNGRNVHHGSWPRIFLRKTICYGADSLRNQAWILR